MIVTVFDTETTGLPASYMLEEANLNNWPHILQLAYIVYDTEAHKFLEFMEIIIKLPSSVNISEESIRIHGISRETMMIKGVEMGPHLTNFLTWCDMSELIIGHNVEFDYKMVCAELMRLGWAEQLQTFKYYKKFFCTMKSTVNVCNIQAVSKVGKQFTKFPSLTELHYHLFKIGLKNMHNAMNDVLVCFRCFYKLKFDRDLLDDNNSFVVLLYNVFEFSSLSLTKQEISV
jgi:DNA polymerase-3 subunit epsilon